MHEISGDGQQWRPASERTDLFASPATAASPVQETHQAATATTQVASQTNPSAAGFMAEPRQAPWYYAYGGKEQGPVDYRTLSELFATRRLAPETEVWSDGMPQWVPASTIPGLAPVVHSPPVSTAAQATVDSKSASGEISPGVIRALTDARPWVVFISVMGFIYAAMWLVGGMFQVIAGSRSGVSFVVAAGLFNLIFAVIVGIGSWLLINHSGWISRLERTHREETLRSCLIALKSFWVFVGIILIVFLAIAVIAAVFVFSVIGSFPDLSQFN